ncbi:MAG: diacylglycerol kinase family protein [Candidatus Omnitrophica bacterium]|nr:diacylglycerol kinase family protein [Candidatus Omnitrophota bacterium]
MILKIIKKIFWASEGAAFVFKNELSFRIELAVGVVVIIAGFIFHLGRIEWCFVILGIALIFSLEFLNTAVEKILNFFHPSEHPEVKVIKDIAAGAVLIANIMAAVIGVIIFLPHVLALWH